MQLYGIDWSAMLLLITSWYFIQRGKRVGFLIGTISCFMWIAVAAWLHNIPLMCVNIFLAYCNTSAYIKFNKIFRR